VKTRTRRRPRGPARTISCRRTGVRADAPRGPASRHARNIAEKNLKSYLVLGRFFGLWYCTKTPRRDGRRSAQQVSRLNEAAGRQAVPFGGMQNTKGPRDASETRLRTRAATAGAAAVAGLALALTGCAGGSGGGGRGRRGAGAAAGTLNLGAIHHVDHVSPAAGSYWANESPVSASGLRPAAARDTPEGQDRAVAGDQLVVQRQQDRADDENCAPTSKFTDGTPVQRHRGGAEHPALPGRHLAQQGRPGSRGPAPRPSTRPRCRSPSKRPIPHC